MLGSALVFLLALSTPAPAAEVWLKVDGFDDSGNPSEVGFQMGFVDGECWAVVYTPEPEHYPFTFKYVDALIGNRGVGDFVVNFYTLSGTEMSTATYLGGEMAEITGSDDSMNRLTVDELELGLPSVTEGNVAVSYCFSGHSGTPAIARDTDGMDYANQNWIYASDGRWYKSQMFGLTGDWIQRLAIETDGDADTDADSDSDTDTDSDADTDSGIDASLTLGSITPTSADVGEAVDVVLIGTGFLDGAQARIGGISLTGTTVVNDETIQGRTPTSLPAGTHDVEVVNPDGDNAYLAAAFTVEDGKGGCATGSAADLGLVGLLVSFGLTLKRKRDRA